MKHDEVRMKKKELRMLSNDFQREVLLMGLFSFDGEPGEKEMKEES